MMTYQPLKLGPMQQCGSLLRRALQNDSLVPLDLLVREAVQNSLDAAEGTGPVTVDFRFRDHAVDPIAKALGDCPVAVALRERGSGHFRLLEIRDSGTMGLTGPSRLEELTAGTARGNLLKLVYEVGRTQDRQGAGGSWGLGKTVYYRLGVGLVFFYSRFRLEGGGYGERLAACIVEDEGSPNRLQRQSATGIAWWGLAEGGPLLRPEEIHPILAELAIEPYQGDQTGTSIVVPFLRNDLAPGIPDPSGGVEDDDDGQAVGGSARWRPHWEADPASYLQVALQRWYCVRLDNDRFQGGPPLRGLVNGQPVRAGQMLPVFKVVQALYNLSVPSPMERTAKPLVESPDHKEISIRLNAVLEGDAEVGVLAVARVDRTLLGLDPPHNQPEPDWALHGRAPTRDYRPILGFIREPGMIVRWDDRDDSTGWTGSAPALTDAYVVALFVPHCERRLTPRLQERLGTGLDTIGSYLRRCELADHRDWLDPAGQTVCQRIRAKTARTITDFSGSAKVPAGVPAPLLAARILADRLLPRGFGTDGRHGTAPRSRRGEGGGGPGGGAGGSPNPSLEVRDTRHVPGGVEVDWIMSWGRGAEPREMLLLVDSESAPIGAEEWAKEAVGAFPLHIEHASVRLKGAAPQAGQVAPDRELQCDQQATRLYLRCTGAHPAETELEGTISIRLGTVAGVPTQPVLRVGIARPPAAGAQ